VSPRTEDTTLKIFGIPYVSRLSGGYYGIAGKFVPEIPYYLTGKLLDIMGSNILSLIAFVSGDLHMSNGAE